MWKASSENVSLRSSARLTLSSLCQPHSCSLMSRDRWQGRSTKVTLGKKEPLGPWLLAIQRNCSSAQKAKACHITEVALFALQTYNTIRVLSALLIQLGHLISLVIKFEIISSDFPKIEKYFTSEVMVSWSFHRSGFVLGAAGPSAGTELGQAHPL